MYGKPKKLQRASKCRMLLFFQVLAMTFFPMYFGKAGDFRTQFGNNSVIYNAEAPQGGTAKFPCDITSSGAGERLSLVMWYKQGRVSPIYSYDVRNVKMLGKGVHWLDKEVLGERAHFRPNGRPAAQLIVEQVQSNDAGLYRCRADYNKIPTRNHFVNFTVIVPVEKVAILDRDGKHIRNYKLGPFNEGESISISCVATGGEPPPRVSWWLENTLLNNVSTLILSSRRVENSLRLDPLRRSHLNRVFTCRASNSALIPPISSAVKLLINLRPLLVKLRGENRPLSAGHSYELECEVVGAVPPPTVTWWKGSAPVTTSKTVTTGDGNTTISILHFIPSIEDGGKYLSCRGEQPFITESGLEDGWKLDVHHVPVVTLELGSTVNSSIMKEGADVYFECNIKSNPWIYQIRWMHNTKQLYNNVAEGMLVSNQSLVLQGVTRSSSGVYTCVASNREGDGESNPVQLDVKFAPICRPGQVQSFGVGRGEIAKIPCELEGNPAKINFTWIFNTTESSGEIPQNKVLVEPLRSIAQYTPETETDFGTLSCWGQNDVGLQTVPCVFRLTAAGKPDKLLNCTVCNQTENSFLVECMEGYDGGLPQEFMIDVYTSNQKLITTVASKQPKFVVVGLDSGKSYEVVAVGINKKGRGAPFVIQTQTLRSATKYRGYLPTVEDLRESPGALIAVSIVVLICVGIMATCIYEKITWMSKSEERDMEVCDSRRRPPHLQQSSPDTSDDHNPDVIPQGGDGDEFSEEERAFEYLKTAPPRMYAVTPRTSLPMLQATTFTCDTSEKVTYSELIHAPQMAERMVGTTLPRPKGPLIYAQLDVSRAPQQNVYATMDCRTTKTGIAESNPTAPATLPPAAYNCQPPYGPAGVTRLSTLPRTRLDSAEMTHAMMPMQPLGECRYPQVPQATEMNRF